MVVASACGGSPSVGRVTIEFATQGVGFEGAATRKAVDAFNRANPGVQVTILTLSPQASTAYQQLTRLFIAGSPAPDVISADVTWPAILARSGWIQSVDRFSPPRSGFFTGQVESGIYNDRLYAIPWFINAEGVYYRTDLVPRAPTSPQELLQDARSAMQKRPSTLKEGFAFPADNYEGLVPSFINFAGGFGGSLDLSHIASSQNVLALTYMKNLILADRVTPLRATSWQDPDVEFAYLSGQAAFAMSWQYVLPEAQATAGVKGRTAWIPFPSRGGARAALGGDDLVINARSPAVDAAYRFIRYLTSTGVQVDRALSAGAPPAVQAAYGSRLFSQAPYFREEQKV